MTLWYPRVSTFGGNFLFSRKSLFFFNKNNASPQKPHTPKVIPFSAHNLVLPSMYIHLGSMSTLVVVSCTRYTMGVLHQSGAGFIQKKMSPFFYHIVFLVFMWRARLGRNTQRLMSVGYSTVQIIELSKEKSSS